jgi:short-subunit dehydrogenase
MTEPWSYRGRWALVTGASAGIGEALARRLAERGMSLVLTARREDRLRALGAELEGACGVKVVPIGSDLGRAGEAGKLWERAAEGRTIDLLVNNAGFGARGRFDELPLERQVEMVQLNCTSVLELAHHALREMRARDAGGIINVSSIAAFQPVASLATYAASKAFVLSLSESIWAETRGSGVRVVALCPGRTPTEFQAVAGTGRAEGTFGARTPDQVALAGLAALEANRSYEVPGLENYLATWVVRILPHSAVTRVLKRLVKRAAEKKF